MRAADTRNQDYPTVQALRFMGHLVSERSTGRHRIKVFHSRQLGEEKDTLEQTRFGVIDFTRVNTAPLNNLVPATLVVGLPFLFRDTAHMQKVMDGPIGAQVRIVQEPQRFHGHEFQRGERIFLMMNAANRDPRAYREPDRVDLARHGPPHLSFGFGAHICLGFPLARLEGQVAIPAVLARWRHIEPAASATQWLDSLVLRGMTAFPVRVRG